MKMEGWEGEIEGNGERERETNTMRVCVWYVCVYCVYGMCLCWGG